MKDKEMANSKYADLEHVGLAPLVVFVYDREDKARSLLGSLATCDLTDRTELFIFSDGPKNEAAAERVNRVRSCVESMKLESVFDKVHIVKQEKNRGLAKSIIEGVTVVINQYGKVIVVEDDNIVSTDFLKYMNYCLERYHDNPIIGSIAGLSPMALEEFPHDYENDVYLLNRTCSFAWGTWSEIWNSVDWEVADYKEFRRNKKARKQYNRSGNGSAYLLDAHMFGRVNSWAVRFDYSHFKHGQYTLYPKYSKAKNTGYDGSGTHYKKNQKLKGWEKNVSRIDFSKNHADENWDAPALVPVEAILERYKRDNMVPPVTLLLKYLKMYVLWYKKRLA